MEQNEILKKLNENADECIIRNRRKNKEDFLLQLINIVSFGIWFVVLVLIGICDRAGIKIFNLNQTVKGVYNFELFKLALLISTVVFVVSFVLLLASVKRSRRRTDKMKTSLLFSEIISFIIGILLIFKLI